MWFKVDDKLDESEKILDTAETCPYALGLWVMTGAVCGKAMTDGVVTARRLAECIRKAGLTERQGKQAVAALVAHGLWHDRQTIRKCRCAAKLPEGAVFFHDWSEYQPTQDETLIPTERLRWRRKQALKRNRTLCEQVAARDRGRCRYCSVRVNWKDRKGASGATYDHVDPDGDNSLANVVTACRKCNGIKRDRTPAEADMVLLEPPSSDLVANWIGTGSAPDGTQVASAPHARDETGQVGSGSAPDFGSGLLAVPSGNGSTKK